MTRFDNIPIHQHPVDRYWFLTWTTYGTWLPGDQRGWVGWTRDERGHLYYANEHQTRYSAPDSNIEESARRRLKTPPVYLSIEQSRGLFEQFHETAEYRRWRMVAVAIMSNHAHILVGVPGDPDPEKVLGDFKSYG